jgi:hypothetical protein
MADRFFAYATITPVAYLQITDISVAQGIRVDGRVAVIQALNQHVRWRDDGPDPTPTTGQRINAGDSFLYTGDLRAIKFIEEAAGAELNISTYQ